MLPTVSIEVTFSVVHEAGIIRVFIQALVSESHVQNVSVSHNRAYHQSCQTGKAATRADSLGKNHLLL